MKPSAQQREVFNALLLGSTGMLGRALLEELQRRGIETDAPSSADLDLTILSASDVGLFRGYDAVINAAAYTDVDAAEHDARCFDVNCDGAVRVAELCRRAGTPVLTYSSDYVFDGTAATPIPTDAPLNPINCYGHTKAGAERLISMSGADSLIVRTSWLYAPWGNNFVRTIARLARERDTLRVVNDQRGRPTSARTLARASIDLLLAGATGVRHVCDSGGTEDQGCTWFELADETRRLLGTPCSIVPCTSEQFPRPAARPAYTVLDLSETESQIGSLPDWRLALAQTLTSDDWHQHNQQSTVTPSGNRHPPAVRHDQQRRAA